MRRLKLKRGKFIEGVAKSWLHVLSHLDFDFIQHAYIPQQSSIIYPHNGGSTR